MPTPPPTDKTSEFNCYILLCVGTLLLAAGLYFALAKSGSSALILILMGGSIAAFATVAIKLLRTHQHQKPDTKSTEPKATPDNMPESQAKCKVAPEPMADTAKVAALKSVPKVERKVETLPAVVPVKAPATQPDAHGAIQSGVAQLMGTPLGELLLAAILKDPESAGHFIAQAIQTAQAPASIRSE